MTIIIGIFSVVYLGMILGGLPFRQVGRTGIGKCAALPLTPPGLLKAGIAVMAGLLLSACDPSSDEPPLSMSQKQRATLDAAIETFMTDHNIPGAVVGVWMPGGDAYVVARGKANLESDTALQTDYQFGIGSTTKSFVGTVALQLVDEGRLRLDDHLAQFLPDFPNGEHITVRQLLNMTSGIYDYSLDPAVNDALAANPQRKWSRDELVNVAASGTPYFAPGQGWRYSNSNTFLVGLIIEKVTGHRLEDEITARIIQPLGLTHTAFPVEPTMTVPYATGYQYDPDAKTFGEAPMLDPSYLWAAGAMVSNIDDLRVWAESLATGGLLSEALHQERLKFNEITLAGVPAFYAAMDPGYGLAIERYDASDPFIGHSGRTNAYNAQMYYLQSQAVVIITLTNTDTLSGYGPLFFATVAKIAIPGAFPDVTSSP